jgi:ribosomal protein L37AE/L43A
VWPSVTNGLSGMTSDRGSDNGATVVRPSVCPFCNSRDVDTLAKRATVTTYWRCRVCQRMWTIAGLATLLARPR